jgi:SOS-response transcriptional repressor LexA
MDLDRITVWRQGRMEALAKKLGGKAPLGRALGYADGAYVGQMIRGDRPITEKTVAEAEALPGCAGWFKLTTSNVVPGPNVLGKVPLISWVRAGEPCETHDNFPPGIADDWLDCPVAHGPRTFCLEISGDSMDDGSADAYRDGEIIFVDPDARAEPGRDVVVRTPDNRATFKRLKHDQEGPYLLGLNGKKIVRVPDGTVFCGVVIFSGRRR